MNMTQTINDMILEFDEYPYDINNGRCEDFAEAIVKKMPGATSMWNDFDNDDPNHCYVRYNGRYYDAECPEGVNSPDDLPIFC